MDRHARSSRMRPPVVHSATGGARPAALWRLAATALSLILLAGCSRVGRLQNIGPTVAPVVPDTALSEGRGHYLEPLRPLFGDTLIGLVPGSGDSSRRFLGRLRDGYTVDTLNIILCGDNRPGYRLARLAGNFDTIRQGLSLNPIKFLRGVITIPVMLVRSLYPDLALIRELPAVIRHQPKWGREHQVMSAMLVKIDSLHAHGQNVAAVINTGDLVYDGQRPANWDRFLRLVRPLSSRVPYFPVAGNHERTDTVNGVENWRSATGLPVGGDRLYYCFDSADGWVRFIALDTNPIVDPGGHWTREVQIKYSKEEFDWLVARVKEHTGPVVVMMHHPPFSVSEHRMEWQRDSVLTARRASMVRALHESGISIIASGHEHSYQRALLTWPDAVLITIVTAGGGAPLNPFPTAAAAAQIFSDYKVAGAVVKPENVFTSQGFNFTHLRLWFGGGDIRSYSVDQNSKATEIDKVAVDLKRYGVPKIDQHKIPLPPAKGPTQPMTPTVALPNKPQGAKVDSVAASQRLLSKPPPSAARRGKRGPRALDDSTAARPRRPSTSAPAGKPTGR